MMSTNYKKNSLLCYVGAIPLPEFDHPMRSVKSEKNLEGTLSRDSRRRRPRPPLSHLQRSGFVFLVSCERIFNRTLGVVGVVGVLVADTPPISRGQRCQISSRNTPLVCFRTKSDVHPVRTKSLSEQPLHNFEIFGKTYLTLFAQ